jgi:prolyl-tRNA synthetase
MSKLFSQTLREAPAEAEIPSHRLLVRAGYIRQLGAGVYTNMPLAKRSLTKIENIMREEIDAIGGQEMTMPVINPADVWKETNRWYEVGSEMSRFHDRNGRDMVLAITHEEVVGDLVRKEIHSYRQLPLLVYHIQTKWRDDPRPRAGLIRVYRAHFQAYFNIFNRCNLPTIAVKADPGMMGGSMSHEYMYLTPVGEDTILICDECGYTANRQIALFQKPIPEEEELLPKEKVATPGVTTITDLAQFLGVPDSKTAKAVFQVATLMEGKEEVEKFVFVVVRGDMEVNETKLVNAVNAKALRPAEDEEIMAVGAVPGYASPMGLSGVLVVVDDLILKSPNLVSGANEEGFHMLNVNYGRDFEADIVTDIVTAEFGAACPECSATMRTSRGIEVGNIFKLGTRYSDPLGCEFLDKDGKSKPVVMGSYGIGSGRLLASIAEEYHDDYGLIWPITVAPYHVHLVALRKGEIEAEKLYEELLDEGVEVLFDDRDETPGVKFNDADLIGIPIRVTVSKRSLDQNGVEIKLRTSKDKEIVALDDAIDLVHKMIADLTAVISEKVVEVPFEE